MRRGGQAGRSANNPRTAPAQKHGPRSRSLSVPESFGSQASRVSVGWIEVRATSIAVCVVDASAPLRLLARWPARTVLRRVCLAEMTDRSGRKPVEQAQFCRRAGFLFSQRGQKLSYEDDRDATSTSVLLRMARTPPNSWAKKSIITAAGRGRPNSRRCAGHGRWHSGTVDRRGGRADSGFGSGALVRPSKQGCRAPSSDSPAPLLRTSSDDHAEDMSAVLRPGRSFTASGR